MIPVKTLHLKNKKGESLTLKLRACQPGDENGMIACIRDEYGDTYFKQDFYDPAYLRMEARAGRITFLAAEAEDGELAGMMILKQFFPERTVYEVASQIFRKKYRGYGLALPFFRYGLEILRQRPCSAVYCLPVMFHNITQRLLRGLGLRATGLILNVFDLEHITCSYDPGGNSKHSQGIQVMAGGRRDAGVLYLPREHQKIAQAVYESLGVSFQIREGAGKGVSSGTGIIRWKNDSLQSSLEIFILAAGSGVCECIRRLHKSYPLKGKQTANIFLNISEPNAPELYESLKAMGYFFTGFRPLSGGGEYMVLHHPGKVDIYFDDYVVTSEFARLLFYITGCYEELYGPYKRRRGKDEES